MRVEQAATIRWKSPERMATGTVVRLITVSELDAGLSANAPRRRANPREAKARITKPSRAPWRGRVAPRRFVRALAIASPSLRPVIYEGAGRCQGGGRGSIGSSPGWSVTRVGCGSQIHRPGARAPGLCLGAGRAGISTSTRTIGENRQLDVGGSPPSARVVVPDGRHDATSCRSAVCHGAVQRFGERTIHPHGDTLVRCGPPPVDDRAAGRLARSVSEPESRPVRPAFSRAADRRVPHQPHRCARSSRDGQRGAHAAVLRSDGERRPVPDV